MPSLCCDGNGWTPLIFLLGVVMGTGSAISAKVAYGLQAEGEDGNTKYFEKPLFLTLLMFVAMAFALPLHWIHLWFSSPKRRVSMDIWANNESRHADWRTIILLLVPTLFDLAATALAAAGLMFTTVSVYQMIRTSVMIMTALIKAALLRQSLTQYMWIGISINTVAMVMISAINFIPGHMEEQPGVHHDPRFGIALILLSCVVQASQYVFEEKLMSDDNAPPLLVVGVEGVWGTLLMLVIAFPWAAMLPGQDEDGCLENLFDSYIMVQNSKTLQAILAVYFFSVFFFNIFAVYVTFLLNSVWHAILENFRPGSIWLLDLLLYYALTSHAFGESWTRWSWLELGGMIMMLFGTAVFNASIQLPGCEYIDVQWPDEKETTVVDSLTPISASPLIQRGINREHRLAKGFASIQNLNRDIEYDSQDSSEPHDLPEQEHNHHHHYQTQVNGSQQHLIGTAFVPTYSADVSTAPSSHIIPPRSVREIVEKWNPHMKKGTKKQQTASGRK